MTAPVSEWRLDRFGVPARLIERSGTFGGLDEGSSAREKYLIPQRQLLQFVSGSFPPPDVSGTKIRLNTSQMPGLPFMRTERVNWRGFTAGLPVDPFSTDLGAPADTYQEFIELDVEYRSKPLPDDTPNTFLEISANTTGEYLHGGGGSCFWAGGLGEKEENQGAATRNQDPSPPVPVVVPMTEWSLHWPLISVKFFEETLVGRLRARMGKVNQTSFSLIYDAAPQTAMFVGYDYSEQHTFTGDNINTIQEAKFVSVTMKFVEKHAVDENGVIRGHNDFWKKGTGWQYLWCGTAAQQDSNTLKPVYPLTEMNDIFIVGHGTCTWVWTGTEYELQSTQCLDDYICDTAPVGGAGLEDGSTFTKNCIPPGGA